MHDIILALEIIIFFSDSMFNQISEMALRISSISETGSMEMVEILVSVR